MKAYSIGREAGCNIVINDSTDVISRRHAILNVYSNGKMTITDQSHNGTYVNGMRITPNVPVPVTRKDNVSFAHVARLDWNQVPGAKGSSTGKIVLFTLLGVLLAGGIVAAVLLLGGKGTGSIDPDEEGPDIVMADSLRQDSLTNDTIQPIKVDTDKQEAAKDEAGKGENADKDAQADKDSKDEVADKDCPVCGKKLSECLYDGNHPRCQYCGKATDATAKNRCQYNGQHPRCQYCHKVVGASRNACPYNGNANVHEEKAQQQKQQQQQKEEEQVRRH